MNARRGRGERAGLSREQILDAALDLADRDGLSALTMRQVGAELGVEAMTLYHYVPNKDALLDGMVERVFTTSMPALADGTGWADMLRRYAYMLREGLLRHPGILTIAASRPAVTPATLDQVEAALRLLTGVGFPLDRAVHTVNVLSLFVIGHAANEATLTGATAAADAKADAKNMADAGSPPWLSRLDPDRYPLVVEAAGTGQGTDDAERFDYAIDVLLAGFAARGPGLGPA